VTTAGVGHSQTCPRIKQLRNFFLHDIFSVFATSNENSRKVRVRKSAAWQADKCPSKFGL